MKRHECSREGCSITYSHRMYKRGWRHCSALCFDVNRELDRVISRLQETENPLTQEALTLAYTTLVEIADHTSTYQEAMRLARLAEAKAA